jgi:hypothetical protein
LAEGPLPYSTLPGHRGEGDAIGVFGGCSGICTACMINRGGGELHVRPEGSVGVDPFLLRLRSRHCCTCVEVWRLAFLPPGMCYAMSLRLAGLYASALLIANGAWPLSRDSAPAATTQRPLATTDDTD